MKYSWWRLFLARCVCKANSCMPPSGTWSFPCAAVRPYHHASSVAHRSCRCLTYNLISVLNPRRFPLPKTRIDTGHKLFEQIGLNLCERDRRGRASARPDGRSLRSRKQTKRGVAAAAVCGRR
ncbi:hypothetical protein EVAR_64762_1 [Eumeta japonica]|uniref:Secreted protein n=1 Tax=Eumeta variegata TaxID=151549 RepID=A0A4C1ZEE6_EUMVA|nr:hypothetical protein EVAR_64762_1 [Eumeta japonica]